MIFYILIAIFISSFKICLFEYLAHFKIRWFIFLYHECAWVSCIFCTLTHYINVNILFSIGFLFILLTFPWIARSIFTWYFWGKWNFSILVPLLTTLSFFLPAAPWLVKQATSLHPVVSLPSWPKPTRHQSCKHVAFKELL